MKITDLHSLKYKTISRIKADINKKEHELCESYKEIQIYFTDNTFITLSSMVIVEGNDEYAAESGVLID